MAAQIKVLGHIVSHNQVKMDPDKISAITNRARPTNLKELQSFLGLPNFNRRFIQDYSKIAYPLFALCAKGTKFELGSECEAAFQLLKKKCSSYPILKIPNPNSSYKLYTDVSGYALGAI